MNVETETVARALADAGLLVERRGTLPKHVLGITDDSRRIISGGVFVAVRGSERDGHDYLEAAAKSGAAVVILEDASRSSLPALVVNHGRRAAAVAGAASYGFPAGRLR